ncbi:MULTISPECIES: site-specific integrase [Pseudorhizobium]|uniref:Phage integrase/recombinase n=1 Tax=Pseudorhizobium halotolerans TaxID=1233081 RepID=A0ABM8PRD0_9HYPH|nr:MULTISPECIES: site-specific integrase [Pseudorhizobium]CAD7044349.1 phage integrase/recombinase [Pseudorhizobium halotolerans]
MKMLPDRLMVRNGTFYFRLWIPKDIVPVYGRQLVVTSLRTKDLKTAKTRLARKTVEAEEQFEELRSKSQGANGANEATPAADQDALRATFPRIVSQHALTIRDREFEQRAAFYAEATREPRRLWSGELMALPTPAHFGHGEADAYTYFDHLVAEGDLDKIIGFLNQFRLKERVRNLKRMRATGDVEEFVIAAQERLAGLNDRSAVSLARLLLDTELSTIEAILGGDPIAADQVAPLSPAPVSDVAKTSNPPPSPLPLEGNPVSIDAIFEKWERETNPSASTLSSWRGIVRDLKSFLGPKANDIRTVVAADIVAWKDKLVRDKKAAATISRGYLGCARALFRFAIANQTMATDPTEGIKVIRKAKAGTRMLGYTNDEVAKLLALATEAKEPWKRWLPWLAAATGSRIGEVAQLHGSHVTEEEGYAVLKIQPASDAGSIKNESSERTVPIHPALIEAGFLEFVASRGSGPLFYSRSSGDPKRKHASKGVSNRLGVWIRSCGFRDSRKAPNHALRHWFKTEAARVGVSDSVADAIQGHSDGSSSAVYRHIGIPVMVAALEKIKLPPR